MTGQFTQDAPETECLLDSMRQDVIGKPLVRIDALAKATGTATYAAEYPVKDCLEGVLVTAPFARGRITGIDIDTCLACDGVVAVIDNEKLIARCAQGTAGEAPVQEVRKVAYWGQPFALVVAETFEQARDASKHLKITIQDDDLSDIPCDPQAVEPENQQYSSQGDLPHAMTEAPHSVDAKFTTAGHASAAMEPHAAIAQWDGQTLTVHASLQMLNYNISELADAVGLEENQVRIVSRFVGGGFGSKLGISAETVAASLAAMQLKRPVRVAMSRQQVFQCVMRRSETSQRMRLAAGKDGTLQGFGHEALVSNLPDEQFAEPVLQSSEFLYAGDNRLLTLDLARVHRMTAGSVRAPGEAVGMPTLEVAMDMLAEACSIDPVELRLKNIPDRHPMKGTPFSSHKLAECLQQGAEAFGWDSGLRKPRQRREGEWWIGTGMASAARVHNIAKAKARVTLNPDGTALVESDMTDLGTGTYTILGQIAGEMLGLDPSNVLVDLGDTRLPRGPGSGGSWGAASIASAVYVACKAIREKLTKYANVTEGELNLKDGGVEGGASFAQLLGDKELREEGHYEPGDIEDDYVAAGFGAYFAEVRVNAFTGETRVNRMTGAFGFGRVLNERTARSQCQGGMVWSIGAALTEALHFDPRDGHLVNCDLAEYHVPVNRDVPELEVIMVEERDPAASPIQAKGIGELGMCGGAAAIANAIYNACGARVRDFPITPDRVVACMPD
ncbi:xanthine dehydrogenase family protein molybdopterin-binding subunit [Aurantiacibacter xanthus]|uniref:Xanthine dehydrogenase family protein molybdopterin-binding subunit n=1 Tax=Aurantiacibacter xanthus TaxID=1784712 RepID=A0A3A1PJ31_9SPHN|nr:xanthine dehydrogenase family protein molybdopterin-binding subunit [Aurantiacibacter xanthus]RIV92745.1 xanthine dehydrogenase family protein molybdopterin-binding subunit [Aurantiacibacter xanthus]